MPITNETTSLLCLFHHEDHANAAIQNLEDAGIPRSSTTRLTGADASPQLTSYGMPERDLKLLEDNLSKGAILLVVNAAPEQVASVERIFGKHSAKFVDEFERKDDTVTGLGQPIPIVEEELAVGKRTVDQGGVRVFRRIVEIPVSESVQLREEHVVIDRQPVDRAATAADLDSSGRSVELVETAEEVVLTKSAHVVEEILVSKQSSDRVEHIEDTVRRTEVEVEELPARSISNTPTRGN